MKRTIRRLWPYIVVATILSGGIGWLIAEPVAALVAAVGGGGLLAAWELASWS